MHPGPVLARELRSGRIQALHTGHAVVLDAAGNVRLSWGDPGTATFWRSAAKPLQALPFAAVADRMGLGDAAIAVACGSHAAEPFHVQVVRRILAAEGLDASLLQCGVHDPGPLSGPMPPGGWTALQNNCSGKHAAMLATCRRRGLDLASYLHPDHPLQAEIRQLVAEAAGATDVPVAVDGCGLPTFHLPIVGLARAFQWLPKAPAGQRVLEAMARRPEMVGGTANADSDLPAATGGRVVSKYGALGVVGAIDRKSGEALAVKMDAGVAQPARAVALAVMEAAGWLRTHKAWALVPHLRPELRNHAGLRVGEVAVDLTPSSP